MFTIAKLFCFALALLLATAGHGNTTAADPQVDIDELRLLVKPLTADELKLEARAWLALVKLKTEDITHVEIAIRRKNSILNKAEAVEEALHDSTKQLDAVKSAAIEAAHTSSAEAARQAADAAEKAVENLETAAETIDAALQTARFVDRDKNVAQSLDAAGSRSSEGRQLIALARDAHRAAEAVAAAAERAAQAATQGRVAEIALMAAQTTAAIDGSSYPPEDGASQEPADPADSHASPDSIQGRDMEQMTRIATELTKREMADKKALLDSVTALHSQRTALIDRLNVVLDELELKLGKPAEGENPHVVANYRLYADAVRGIKVDVADTQATWATVAGWLRSEEGGIRWARNVGLFLFYVVGFWVLGRVMRKLLDNALRLTSNTPVLLKNFLLNSVGRLLLILGIVLGLSALEINIAPLMAIIGAAGFVVAFALQNTLSNFASGIMIMLYRPFDVGDVVDVAGVSGTVQTMNLVTTTINTFDNKIMIVPNNSIWGNIITNITGSEQRRIDLVFRIGYHDDLHRAKQVLRLIVDNNPDVLPQPEAVIEVHELADSSVNLICRPWARTGDYWKVYWSITQSVKEHFDQEGINIPYPHHTVQLNSPARPPGELTG